MISWIAMGIFVRRSYLSHLVESIQKRRLGELSVAQLDRSSLAIITAGLGSPFPAEICYYLDTLEKMEHPDLANHIQYTLANKNQIVKLDALKRIEKLQLARLSPGVKQHMQSSVNPQVRSQAFRTYAVLSLEDTLEQLRPGLTSAHPNLRSGALVGILSFSETNDDALDHLRNAVCSDEAEERIFAANVMGDLGGDQFFDFLIELMQDPDTRVIEQAIIAAGQGQDTRLIGRLVNLLNSPRYRGCAGLALQRFGKSALYELDIAFNSLTATRPVKCKILEIIQKPKDPLAQQTLLRYLGAGQLGLRHVVYLGLANLHYQANADDHWRFVSRLHEEAKAATWLLASMMDLHDREAYEHVAAALRSEFDVHRDNLMLLASFIFGSAVMMNSRANIDSNVADLHIFALETLDNLLSREIRLIMIPLLEDLTISERLTKLQVYYPQASMAPEDRSRDIVLQHFDDALFWTRSCLLFRIGQKLHIEYLDVVQSCLKDPEPIVNETALWALAQLKPAESAVP
jgi:hypothetical protein